MGHERLGLLPKTKPWLRLVEDITSWARGETEAVAVSQRTILNVQSRLARFPGDAGVLATFEFLVKLAVCAGADVPLEALARHGISVEHPAQMLDVVAALKAYVYPRAESMEYSALATDAAAKAVAQWYARRRLRTEPLFAEEPRPLGVLKDASKAAGFCELAAGFFTALTEGYLNYFLERAASAALDSVEQRERLAAEIHAHAKEVGQHAMETAKITQSFAAGWFNRYAQEKMPAKDEQRRFLRVAFGKLQEELLRETTLP